MRITARRFAKVQLIWVIVLILLLAGGCTRGGLSARPEAALSVHPAGAQPAVVAPAPPTPRRFSQGEILYIRYCADCHGWEGRGDGPLAHILTATPQNLRQQPELFATHSDAELIARILSGKALLVPVDPTALPYTETEVTALLTYLQRLPTLSWTAVNRGKEVYDSLCTSCHGLYGRGDGLGARALAVPPRDLTARVYQEQIGDEELLRIIADGKGAMPGAADVLTAHEVRAVITFLRVLSPGYELYTRFCAYCHGFEGLPPASGPETRGSPHVEQAIPAFDETYFRIHPIEQVRAGIQHMRKQSRPAMPHFSGQLSADEVSDIVTYLRTLPPES
ncbi:MAG TPA: c-type cytochrome [Candidatus Binatia bacterium]|nr:c-type cytochrome [Candidatus Binatia bacterium]